MNGSQTDHPPLFQASAEDECEEGAADNRILSFFAIFQYSLACEPAIGMTGEVSRMVS